MIFLRERLGAFFASERFQFARSVRMPGAMLIEAVLLSETFAAVFANVRLLIQLNYGRGNRVVGRGLRHVHIVIDNRYGLLQSSRQTTNVG